MWLAVLIGAVIAASWAFLSPDLAMALTFLGVVLGGITLYQGWKMDKKLEEGKRETRELIKETQRMIDEGNRRAYEMMQRTQEMIDEGNRRLERILLEIGVRVKEVHEKVFG